METFFVTCPRGLEQVLEQELTALGALEVFAVDGGVSCAGELALGYMINLESRVASRVLWQVAKTAYRDERDIYQAVRDLSWPEWFPVSHSIRVDVSAVRAPVKSLD